MARLRGWWQSQTGETETPFDGDAPVWLVSMVVHLAALFVLAFVSLDNEKPEALITVADLAVEEELETFEVPEVVFFNNQPQDEIGANSENGEQMALSLAPKVAEVSDIPLPSDLPEAEDARIEINNAIHVATGLQFDANLTVKGAAGEGVTGATGAIDRLTQEILNSLEERKTLVVWIFDQSPSMTRQRKEVHDRFDRVYEELGVLQAADNPAFKKHEDKPLLTSVMSFGDQVNLLTKKPTDNLAQIKSAISGIEMDETGTERIFTAIYKAADLYKDLRVPPSQSRDPERNVLIVAFTDEAGDDQDGLEITVKTCRRYQIPVYIVGVPAPFGRKETMVKWVDPNPAYDQGVQWGEVTQGPESFLPERVKLEFANDEEEKEAIDSGFGPFSLTRLCVETGGIFFAVHPNRNVYRKVSRSDVATFSAHLTHFFDPEVMRQYRPDYVSADEYMKRLTASKARQALVKAAQMSATGALEAPRTRYARLTDAELSNALTEAQKDAAKLEPKLEMLYQTLKIGEADRAKEASLRWQAGYDLAMGRVMAAKVRTEAYNNALAKAKRGMAFKDPKNNVWNLVAAEDFAGNSQLEKAAEKAREYLTRVAKDHPDTPWGLFAERELKTPLGWGWEEEYEEPPAPAPRPAANPNNNNNPPPPAANEKAKMMVKPPPKRVLKL